MLDGDSQLSYDLFVKLLIGCLGAIVVLNLISLLCGSCYMLADQQFTKWMRINYHNDDNNMNDNHNNKHKKTSLKYTNKQSTNKIMN